MHKIHITFNRSFLTIALSGYIAIVILLGFLDVHLIRGYHQDYLSKQENILEDVSSRLSSSLSELKNYTYGIWLYNEDFAAVGNYRKKENLLSSRHELMQELKNNLSVHMHTSAYILLYSGEEEIAYEYDTAQINSSEMAELKRILLAYYHSDPSASREWLLINAEENPCALLGFTKESASIYCVYSLKSVLADLRKDLPEGSKLSIRQGEYLTYTEENTENTGETDLRITDGTDLRTVFQSRIVKSADIDGTNLTLYMSVPYDFLRLYRGQIILILLVTAIAFIALFAIIIFTRRLFLKPLSELNEQMELIREGGTHKLQEKDYLLKDFNDVNQTMGYMVNALEEQKIAAYEATVEKQNARIQYLQLQLKPHFYLNGLKTVNAMAVSGNTDHMQEYLQHLSAHLRYLLQLERDEIDILKELEFSENYIQLQQEMTGRKIHYSVYNDYPDGGFSVPILCVQTFLENSIKYAKLGSIGAVLELSVEVLHLLVDGVEYLDITVRDNGQGFDEETLRQFDAEPDDTNTNVGINNLKRRCRLLYGGRVEINFSNDGGAINEIIIPRLKENVSGKESI